jgi:hypothetical protein
MIVTLLILIMVGPAIALAALLLEPRLWQRYDEWANKLHDWRAAEASPEVVADEMLREAQG